MKCERDVSVRAVINGEWRSITINLLTEKTDDGRTIGKILSDLETENKLFKREIIELQAKNEQNEKEINTLQKGIKELVELLKVGK